MLSTVTCTCREVGHLAGRTSTDWGDNIPGGSVVGGEVGG